MGSISSIDDCLSVEVNTDKTTENEPSKMLEKQESKSSLGSSPPQPLSPNFDIKNMEYIHIVDIDVFMKIIYFWFNSLDIPHDIFNII